MPAFASAGNRVATRTILGKKGFAALYSASILGARRFHNENQIKPKRQRSHAQSPCIAQPSRLNSPAPHHRYPLPAPYGLAPALRLIRSYVARRAQGIDQLSPSSPPRQAGRAGAQREESPDAR